jgi:hypothetical protein
MVQKVQVYLTCDPHADDGATEATQTISFMLDGELLEFDACNACAARFRNDMSEWRGVARTGTRDTAPRRRRTVVQRDQAARIREWAATEEGRAAIGGPVSGRGRIPRRVVELYRVKVA